MSMRTLFAIMIIGCLSISCSRDQKQAKPAVNSESVYVCTGSSAKRYHSTESCRGLSRCSGEILEMAVEEAEEHGRTPCRMCVEN